MLRRTPVAQWFRPKMFGAGWSPNSWEGWAVTLVGAPLVGLGLVRLLQYIGWGGAG